MRRIDALIDIAWNATLFALCTGSAVLSILLAVAFVEGAVAVVCG